MKEIDFSKKEFLTNSRFSLAPINTGFGNNGAPTGRLIRFHSDRSGKNIAISYVGNVAIDSAFCTNESTLILRQNEPGWNELTSAISSNGSLPGIQISCRFFNIPANRKWRDNNSVGKVHLYRNFIASLSTHEIDLIFESFLKAAILASEYGFEVLQIHAAHGYFLSCLMNPMLNNRSDKYNIDNIGGVCDLLANIRKYCPDSILDIRVSCFEGLSRDPLNEWNIKIKQIKLLESYGYDIVSLSAGFYDLSKNLIYPGRRDGLNVYLQYCEELAGQLRKALVSVSGNIRNLKDLEQKPSNIVFGIGRPLVADPYFVEKSLAQRENDIKHCVWSGLCHYYTRGYKHIFCKINDDI
ncbi:hypothetical protein [Marinobacterium litorale]|uniref:oxidoreductase n=1 Tax=Marinobacterium litorale TaxID=404770 RepID=UPI00146FB29F|nr:hypothetical protein [Marinobacterium litorale]